MFCFVSFAWGIVNRQPCPTTYRQQRSHTFFLVYNYEWKMSLNSFNAENIIIEEEYTCTISELNLVSRWAALSDSTLSSTARSLCTAACNRKQQHDKKLLQTSEKLVSLSQTLHSVAFPYIWATSWENLSSGSATPYDSNRLHIYREKLDAWNFGYRN